MSRVLVTGANGFVGRWLVEALRGRGDQVIAGIQPGTAPAADWEGVDVISADLTTAAGVERLAASGADQVVHLAALASGSAARRDPALAWQVNAGGTAALCQAMAAVGRPRLLLVSSGEVYGGGYGEAIPESADPVPWSPYAASKLGAEIAAAEVQRRTGFELVIARPFPHTGPGQATNFVLPALAARLRQARREHRDTIEAGNLDPVRDLLDVRDVVAAYLALLDRGVPGTVYNVASGVGHALRDCLDRMAARLGLSVTVAVRSDWLRPGDIPRLIGDPSRLMAQTGWHPRSTFDQTLQDLVDAQAD